VVCVFILVTYAERCHFVTTDDGSYWETSNTIQTTGNWSTVTQVSVPANKHWSCLDTGGKLHCARNKQTGCWKGGVALCSARSSLHWNHKKWPSCQLVATTVKTHLQQANPLELLLGSFAPTAWWIRDCIYPPVSFKRQVQICQLRIKRPGVYLSV
jgi:hypothetical protein